MVAAVNQPILCCRAMRTNSRRLAGTLVALGFVAGWFSASVMNPPAAATQVRPSRTAAPSPEISLPRIALDAVIAPETRPSTTRNPFAFGGRGDTSGRPRGYASDDVATPAADGGGAPPEEADAAVPAEPLWRVIGIASDAAGAHTAVITGGGGVRLLSVGALLPDGSEVVEIHASHVVLRRAGGDTQTLRLP